MALNLELDSERYVQLLEKLIGETEFLQNNPPRFVPEEDRCEGGRKGKKERGRGREGRREEREGSKLGRGRRERGKARKERGTVKTYLYKRKIVKNRAVFTKKGFSTNLYNLSNFKMHSRVQSFIIIDRLKIFDVNTCARYPIFLNGPTRI